MPSAFTWAYIILRIERIQYESFRPHPISLGGGDGWAIWVRLRFFTPQLLTCISSTISNACGWVTKLIATSFNQPCTITLVRGGGNRQSGINWLILRRVQADGPTPGFGLLAILACLGLFRATNARHGSSKMELISVIPFRSRNCLG